MVKRQEEIKEQREEQSARPGDYVLCEDCPVRLVYDPQGGKLRDRLKRYFLREKWHGSYQKSE